MEIFYSLALTHLRQTVVKDMGFTAVKAQGLTAPPYFLSFLLTIFTTYVADRTQQRGYTIIVMSCVGGIGYILLATCKAVGARYFGVFLAAAGVFPCIANILPWVLSQSLPHPKTLSHTHPKQTTKARTRGEVPASRY